MPFYMLIGGLILIVGGFFVLAMIEQEMPSIKKAIGKMFQSRIELKKAKIELARRKLEIEHKERMAVWKGIDDEPQPIKGTEPVPLKPKQFEDDEQVTT